MTQVSYENLNKMDDPLVSTPQNKEKKYDQELDLLDMGYNENLLFFHSTWVNGFLLKVQPSLAKK